MKTGAVPDNDQRSRLTSAR